MKTLVLYKSKWGATKEYAEYIKNQVIDAELFSVEEFDINNIDNYQKVVIGSRVYMGKIQALDFLTSNWDRLKNKKVFLFAVGLVDPESKSSIDTYNKIPESIRTNIKYTKLPGKVDTKKLGFMDKLIYKMISSQKNNPEVKPFAQEFNVELARPVIEFTNA